MNITYSFILTFIAGLSTLLGYLTIFIKNKNSNYFLNICLSFTIGIMLSISIIDLIPESYKSIIKTFKIIPSILIILNFINIGVIFSMLIDKIFSHKSNQLYHIGIISTIAIIFHNIPEGIATFITSNNNIHLGSNLALAIALHNIPEGIRIAIPIYYSTKNKKKAFNYTFIAALAEPFGAFISYLFLTPYINTLTLGMLYSLIAGIMIQIILYELIPIIIKFKKYFNSFLSFLLGFTLILITILLK